MLVKTVKENYISKTVGLILGRYRLGHWWVAGMLLNVQSGAPSIGCSPMLFKALNDEN